MAGLTGHGTTGRQRYHFAESNCKAMPGSTEFILLDHLAGNLADLNKIGVRNNTGCNLPLHPSCLWNIDKFSSFTLYVITKIRTWIRSHEAYVLFLIILVLQINPHRKHNRLHLHHRIIKIIALVIIINTASS